MSPDRSHDTDEGARVRTTIPWLRLAVLVIAWFGVQRLTFLMSGHDLDLSRPDLALLQGCIAAGVMLALVIAYPDDARMLFSYSRAVWLYGLVPVAIVIYLIRFDSDVEVLRVLVPVALALTWRWFLFAMLQLHLAKWLSRRTVLLLSAVLLGGWFWLGDRDPFGPTALFGVVSSLLVGLLVSAVRLWQKNLHALIALSVAGTFAFMS